MALTRNAMKAIPLAALGLGMAALFSGCGGATTNGSPLAPTPNSGPVVYGLNALALNFGANTQGETSGLAFTDANGAAAGAIMAATRYNTISGAGPLPAYQQSFANAGTTPASSPGLPLGFATSGVYYGTSAPVEALPTNYSGTLTFGAYVSASIQNNLPVDINSSSVTLTSSEAPTFSEPLSFDPNFATDNSVLTQAQYRTATFAMPAFLQTTGLHNLHTTIADLGKPVQNSTTDFSVLALAPTDSAAVVQINYTNPKNSTQVAPVGGVTATITSPLPTVAAYKDSTAPTGASALPLTTSYGDAQGVVILFAAPGTQTVTINGVSPFDGTTAITGTAQVTLTPGVANTTTVISAVLAPTPATGATIARAKLLHRAIK